MKTPLFTTPFQDIEGYARTHFSPELYLQIIAAIQVLEAIEYPYFYDKLVFEINTIQNDDNEQESLNFVGVLEECLSGALEQQGITTINAGLTEKTNILSAVYRSLMPTDPDTYLTVLNTELSNEEILATILEDFGQMNEASLLSYLSDIRDEVIQAYREHYTELANTGIQPEVTQAFLEYQKNITLFLEFTKTQSTLLSAMIDAGLKEGQTASTYYGYVSKQIHEVIQDRDVEYIARNLLSFFYYCSDTYRNPVDTYQKVGESLGVSPDRIQAVMAEMIRQVTLFNQFKDAKTNDTGNLSVL